MWVIADSSARDSEVLWPDAASDPRGRDSGGAVNSREKETGRKAASGRFPWKKLRLRSRYSSDDKHPNRRSVSFPVSCCSANRNKTRRQREADARSWIVSDNEKR